MKVWAMPAAVILHTSNETICVRWRWCGMARTRMLPCPDMGSPGGSVPRDERCHDTSGATSSSSSVTAMELPLASSSDWVVKAVALQFGAKKKAENACKDSDGDSCRAKLSVEQPLIVLHKDDADSFRNVLPDDCAFEYDSNTGFRCPEKRREKLPRITIALADKLFYLDAADYTRASEEAPGYIDVLVSSTTSKTWTLGQPFLR
ncbi:hypothetical protein PINS_up007702 [Pythium insidiosum]|nr:hypothetical protein PINS_up007702 [Pythium insidiosum]